MRTLQGRVALIVGAGSEVAERIAQTLAGQGMRLVLAGRDPLRLAQLGGRLTASGVQVDTVCVDLGDADAVGLLAQRACDAAGEVDVLVWVAGFELTAPFAEVSEAELDRHLWLNVGAPLLLIQQLLPGMLERRCGHVVVIGSLSALIGGAYQVPYAASKAAMDAAVRALRAEYRGSGVGFSIVHPAPIRDTQTYAARVRNHGRVPRIVGETTIAKVAAATERAIRRNRAQVLVIAHPARLLLAVQAISPRAAELVLAATGITRYFRRIAHHDTATGARDRNAVEVSCRTRVPAARVWECLADPYSYARWVSGTAVIRDADPAWPAAGARLRHRFGPWPLQVRDHSTVLACDAPHRLVLDARAWPFGVVRAELTITTLEPGSLVTLREVLMGGLGAHVPRIAALVQRARNRRSLRRLLELSTTQGQPPPQMPRPGS